MAIGDFIKIKRGLGILLGFLRVFLWLSRDY